MKGLTSILPKCIRLIYHFHTDFVFVFSFLVLIFISLSIECLICFFHYIFVSRSKCFKNKWFFHEEGFLSITKRKEVYHTSVKSCPYLSYERQRRRDQNELVLPSENSFQDKLNGGRGGMREMAISIGTINIVFFYFLWPSAKNRCCLNCKIRLSLS